MTWIDEGGGSYNNQDGLALENIDNEPILTLEELEDEGIECPINLLDILDNPLVKVAILDEYGKLNPDTIPSIIIGDTFFARSDSEMLSLSLAQKGDVCIREDLPGGVTFRLLGNNFAVLSNWVELRARNLTWSEVRNKPLQFPPTEHEHDDLYPRIGSNGKISSGVIPVINFFGARFVVDSEDEMVEINSTPGAIAIRKDENKLYLLMGRPDLISSWVYIPSPTASVESVILKNSSLIGNVEITPESIGASDYDHEHEPLNKIMTRNDSELSFRFNAQGELEFYIDDDYISTFAEKGILKDTTNNIDIKIERQVIGGIPILLWADPLNGGTLTPFT